MELNNINEVILAYETDKIDTDTVLQILEAQPIAIAIWIGEHGYEHTKGETLIGLRNYKKHLDKGAVFPFFFPFLSENEPDRYSFNDTLNNGKDL